MEGKKAEKIINDRVDNLLVKMEGIFKGAAEAHKPLQDKLDEDVRGLMAKFDEAKETKAYEKVKAISDYMALTISMPIKEETKEEIIEELVKESEGICHSR